jgi:hypothetical protein
MRSKDGNGHKQIKRNSIVKANERKPARERKGKGM